jgi:prophage regulatory protein
MRILRIRELKDKGIDWSDATIYRRVRAGQFPVPINLSSGKVGWIEEEIDNWIRDCIARRDTPSPEKIAIRESNLIKARAGGIAKAANAKRRKQLASKRKRTTETINPQSPEAA